MVFRMMRDLFAGLTVAPVTEWLGGEDGKKSLVVEVQVGKTTLDNVTAHFGNPTATKATPNGQTTIIYSRLSGIRRENNILIFSLPETTKFSSEVSFTFDQDGLLRTYKNI
jgi:hypothetical protein